MASALSVDIRERVLAAVAGGATHRDAGARYNVSAASVSRWRRQEKDRGHLRPSPQGGDRRSRKTEAHAEAILGWLADNRDSTLHELRDALSLKGIVISQSALHRFLIRHDQTRKKRLATP